MFYLKNKKGEYYSLASSHTCISLQRKDATTWNTRQQAETWLNTHSIFQNSLKSLGFEVSHD